MLRQWEDGEDVCSMYEFHVETPAGAGSVLMTEWNTVHTAGSPRHGSSSITGVDAGRAELRMRVSRAERARGPGPSGILGPG